MPVRLSSEISRRPSKPEPAPRQARRFQRAAVAAVLGALLTAVAAGAVDFAWAASHGRWWPKIWLQSGGMALPWGAVGGALIGFAPGRAALIAVLIGVAQFVCFEVVALRRGWPNHAAQIGLRLCLAAAIVVALWAGGRLQRALGWLDEAD